MQYYTHLSDFTSWDQREHSADWILFADNIGPHLSVDETSLSQGELYTIVTNKAAKGGKGALVAMIKGVKSETVIEVLRKIPESQRNKVVEVTVDLAPTMHRIVKRSFSKATIVSDRFHVQKLAMDAVQELRIQYRWEAIDQENAERSLAKEVGKKYLPHVLDNGDTIKQLLARSRYLLFKSRDKWTAKQCHRAELLFARYPQLEQAYNLSRQLSQIFSKTDVKEVAYKKLALWFNAVEELELKSFARISDTIRHNYDTILNYFNNRNTNAGAESFNAKVKALRAQFRGVSNIPFYLYRLSKIYA